MSTTIDINFKVTPSQKETIDLRVAENGFDNISAYLKVVALKTQTFNGVPTNESNDEESVTLSFQVTELQSKKIEENMKESDVKERSEYLKYVALNGVVTAIVEIRSTGNLDSMLQRIAESRPKLKANPLFTSL